MAPHERSFPLSDLSSVDTGLVERRVRDRFGVALEQARGPRRWLLERKLKKEVEREIEREHALAVRRQTHQGTVHLF